MRPSRSGYAAWLRASPYRRRTSPMLTSSQRQSSVARRAACARRSASQRRRRRDARNGASVARMRRSRAHARVLDAARRVARRSRLRHPPVPRRRRPCIRPPPARRRPKCAVRRRRRLARLRIDRAAERLRKRDVRHEPIAAGDAARIERRSARARADRHALDALRRHAPSRRCRRSITHPASSRVNDKRLPQLRRRRRSETPKRGDARSAAACSTTAATSAPRRAWPSSAASSNGPLPAITIRSPCDRHAAFEQRLQPPAPVTPGNVQPANGREPLARAGREDQSIVADRHATMLSRLEQQASRDSEARSRESTARARDCVCGFICGEPVRSAARGGTTHRTLPPDLPARARIVVEQRHCGAFARRCLRGVQPGGPAPTTTTSKCLLHRLSVVVGALVALTALATARQCRSPALRGTASGSRAHAPGRRSSRGTPGTRPSRTALPRGSPLTERPRTARARRGPRARRPRSCRFERRRLLTVDRHVKACCIGVSHGPPAPRNGPEVRRDAESAQCARVICAASSFAVPARSSRQDPHGRPQATRRAQARRRADQRQAIRRRSAKAGPRANAVERRQDRQIACGALQHRASTGISTAGSSRIELARRADQQLAGRPRLRVERDRRAGSHDARS